MTDRVLILAAGRSSRMGGRDKLLEPVDGQPLLARQVSVASALGWPVHVALPPGAGKRAEALRDGPGIPMPVDESAEGMGGSLRGAVARLAPDTARLLVMLGDLPEITAADLTALVDASDAAPRAAIWRGATEDGKPGHPILFAPETLSRFDALKGDDGGKAVLAAFADRIHLVPLPGTRARRDLDTPEDWARWRAERAAQQQQ